MNPTLMAPHRDGPSRSPRNKAASTVMMTISAMMVLIASPVRLQRPIARTRPGEETADIMRVSGYHADLRRTVANLWQAIGP